MGYKRTRIAFAGLNLSRSRTYSAKPSGFQYDLNSDKYSSVRGINCTIGLPIIRTSVDHGTAFGKAGEGKANEESMLDAIDAAVKMAKYRSDKI